MSLAINDVYLGDCLELMEKLEDDSVDMILCDLPYGTTGLAAVNTGRNFILMEKEEKYWQISKDRADGKLA
jgi:DNA modification methylase